jgi:hypothetical protein
MDIQLNPDLMAAYGRLLIADVARLLPGEAEQESAGVTEAEVRRLIAAASRLALSSSPADRTMAYEIVTRILETLNQAPPELIVGIEHILARLGNFPGRQLLRQRYPHEVAEHRLSMLDLEMMAREVENSVEGSARILTDFQHDLYEALEENKSVSVSAPTSAGKSFVLTLDIIRRIRANPRSSIVYVVPTRALIRQVMLKVVRDVKISGLENVAIRCVPLPIPQEQIKNGVVYILTQERLMSLLHSDEGEPWITTLLIDEAQGIRDDSRGILLQSAIDAVIARFPMVEMCFASPLAKNPEYLLELFGRLQTGRHFIEEHSPVSQNRILVSNIKGSPQNKVRFELLTPNGRLDVGERTLAFSFKDSIFVRRAEFARSITPADSCTIVYADRPTSTEKISRALISNMTQPVSLDPEIAEFIDFLSEHIHVEYPLIEVLRYRVAFHYGQMPAIVRSRVEDLFESGKLQFICCTGTLLQGVNLPARDIVIENPHRGVGKPMVRGDFLNLAGRAGRLLQEFHGNVWCLKPESWEIKSFEGESLQEISAAFSGTLADGGTLIRQVIDGTISKGQKDLGAAALGKLFSEYIHPGKSIFESQYQNTGNSLALEQTVAACNNISVTLPLGVFSRNATILPMKLQALYEFLVHQPDISKYLPILPHLDGSNVRMKEIFQAVEVHLEGVNHSSYKYHALIASRWIHDMPLKGMIDASIAWQKTTGDFKNVGKSIRDLMQTIESDIRYRYVKHLKAYNDVMAVALVDKGQADLVETLFPLHLFLECGASNRVALNLISLGLSRTTALLLKKKIFFPDDATPERCLAILKMQNLRELGLPGLCLRELRDLI